MNAPIPYPFPAPTSLYHPAARFAEVRAEHPVARVVFPDSRTAWLVTGLDEARQVLVDPRFSRAAAASSPDTPQFGLGPLATESIIAMDPPGHTRLRRLVASAFTARRVEELRPRAARLVDELIDAMQRQPRPVDLVENFSLPLPVQVICELLGVPAADRHIFHAWSDTLMGDSQRDPAQTGAAFEGLSYYFAGLIAAKRADPGDDLMTALIAARDERDRLSERELVTMCLGLLIGGHETTANQINMFVLTLMRYPDELTRLRAAAFPGRLDLWSAQDPTQTPDAVPRAVEELMRFSQLGDGGASLPRVTTEDVELGGVTIPKGAAVLPALGPANRDPAVFTDPDRLDLTRRVNPHLGFGGGVHHCLGAQLARMELQEALRGLLRRLPGLRVAVPDAELRFKPGMVVRSLEALPVTW